MNLHVLYRTHRGSNDKPRPDWYDRGTCFTSLRDAARGAGCDVSLTVVADGGMPPELVDAVGPEAEICQINAGTAAGSLRATIGHAANLARRDTDSVFWICEDDYLYRPDAFHQLLAAVRALPDADYFGLFTPKPSGWSASHPSQPDRHFPEIAGGPRLVDGTRWQRLAGTTSTFGVRGRTLVEDARLIILGTRPGAPFDGATWHMLQGARPYSWRFLVRDIDPYLKPRGLAKIVGKPVMRVTLNLAAQRQRRNPRMLVVPEVNLAVHVESAEVDGVPAWRELSDSVSVRRPTN